MSESYWSLGVVIGMPVAGLFVAIGVALIVWVVRVGRRDDDFYDMSRRAGIAIGCVIIVITLIIAGFAEWPWTAEYHQWRPVSGTVSAVAPRLLSAGDRGGTDQKFAVRFADSSQEYGCDDTRCALVRPGDQLELSCKREWQYAGTPGYDCAFVRSIGSR